MKRKLGDVVCHEAQFVRLISSETHLFELSFGGAEKGNGRMMSGGRNQSGEMIIGINERSVGGDRNAAAERIVREIAAKVGPNLNGDRVARHSSTREVQSLKNICA